MNGSVAGPREGGKLWDRSGVHECGGGTGGETRRYGRMGKWRREGRGGGREGEEGGREGEEGGKGRREGRGGGREGEEGGKGRREGRGGGINL